MQQNKSFNKGKLLETLKNFIESSKVVAIEKLLDGCVFAQDFDRIFLQDSSNEDTDSTQVGSSTNYKDKKTADLSNLEQTLQNTKIDFLSEILKIPDANTCWSYVKNLTLLHHEELLQDSFAGLTKKQADIESTKFLSGDKLSIVIFGAGCTGLLFANVLKNKLGDSVNILICENRAYKSRLKKPYTRNWLTNVPIHYLEEKIDPKVLKILSLLGNGNYMGVTINIFETLLLLSCKNLGIHFYFEPQINFDFVKNSAVDLIIDATAGKLDQLYPQNLNLEDIELKYNRNKGNGYAYFGLELLDKVQDDVANFTLKASGNRYHPYFNDRRITYSMFKVTGIPIVHLESITEYTRTNNKDNLFYVWPGNLSPELNEVLIIINIDRLCFAKLLKLINKRTTLEVFTSGTLDIEFLDKRIIGLLKLLQNFNLINKSIYIEPPFSYKPQIQLLPEKLSYAFSKPIIPIGDSVFAGHAKCGNGLEFHIPYASDLAQQIINIMMDELLQKGNTAYTDGKIEEAESVYRFILEKQRNHPDAQGNCMKDQNTKIIVS